MTLLPHQAFVALKRERAARGKRAPPELSIVDGFCRQPSPVYGADSVGPAACPLVLAAAGASPAAPRADARSDSTHATTPDGCMTSSLRNQAVDATACPSKPAATR